MNFTKSVLSLISTTALILPISLTNIQPASVDQLIKERYEGCSYTATYKTWWGSYTYLNGCAITELTLEHNKAVFALGLIGFATNKYTKSQYVNGGLGVAALFTGKNAYELSHCKDTAGQAYMRYAFGFKNYITGSVSCY
jgi:hypothetical protein